MDGRRIRSHDHSRFCNTAGGRGGHNQPVYPRMVVPAQGLGGEAFTGVAAVLSPYLADDPLPFPFAFGEELHVRHPLFGRSGDRVSCPALVTAEMIHHVAV